MQDKVVHFLGHVVFFCGVYPILMPQMYGKIIHMHFLMDKNYQLGLKYVYNN